MTLVSVLIPAYRPAFFETCVASVMTQSHTDFELLVDDASAGGEIETILAKWDDERIEYRRALPQAQAIPGSGRERLLDRARGQYVKFLSDDDMLFPESLEMQLRAAEASDAKLVFSNYCFFDAAGQLLGLSEAVGKGQAEPVSSALLFQQLLGRMNNFIGPMSNVLFEHAALREFDTPFCIAGRRLRIHGNIAAYLNFAQRDFKIVGLGHLGAAVRRHPGQYSHAGKPYSSAGWFEWELLLRWAIEHRRLSEAEYVPAMNALFGAYQGAGAAYDELQLLRSLRGAPGADGFLGEAFREVLRLAYLSIDLRAQLAASAADSGASVAAVSTSPEAMRK